MLVYHRNWFNLTKATISQWREKLYVSHYTPEISNFSACASYRYRRCCMWQHQGIMWSMAIIWHRGNVWSTLLLPIYYYFIWLLSVFYACLILLWDIGSLKLFSLAKTYDFKYYALFLWSIYLIWQPSHCHYKSLIWANYPVFTVTQSKNCFGSNPIVASNIAVNPETYLTFITQSLTCVQGHIHSVLPPQSTSDKLPEIEVGLQDCISLVSEKLQLQDWWRHPKRRN